eukprot:scaffold20959_cov63-Phaeocystis_antarctica.AAC.1
MNWSVSMSIRTSSTFSYGTLTPSITRADHSGVPGAPPYPGAANSCTRPSVVPRMGLGTKIGSFFRRLIIAPNRQQQATSTAKATIKAAMSVSSNTSGSFFDRFSAGTSGGGKGVGGVRGGGEVGGGGEAGGGDGGIENTSTVTSVVIIGAGNGSVQVRLSLHTSVPNSLGSRDSRYSICPRT